MSNLGHISKVDEDCSVLEQEEEKKPALRLDLACGNSKREGFVGVDISLDTQADYLCNLDEYPWKLRKITRAEDGSVKEVEFDAGKVIDDDSVFEIHCSHFIEHVADIKAFMEEIYRILIPGGRVTFYAPYYSSVRAMQDYTHKRFISEATFLYFNKKWMDTNKLQHYGVRCNFAVLSTKFMFNPEWKTRSKDAQEWARQHHINVVSDIEAVLQAIKPFEAPEGDKANDAH
jgi:SAM-dependent methyltransferase